MVTDCSECICGYRACVDSCGRLYFAPLTSGQVLCFDPRTRSVEFIGPTIDGYWADGVTAPDGAIYFPPYGGSHQVLRIDGKTNTVSFLGEFDSCGRKYR